MVALVGAMFVALQSVSAADCVANPVISLGLTDDCEVSHKDATHFEVTDQVRTTSTETVNVVADTGAVAGTVTGGEYTITAANLGTATVSLWDYGTDGTKGADDEGENANVKLAEYEVEVLGFAIAKVEIVGDTDSVVSAGAPVTARVTLRSYVAGTAEAAADAGSAVRLVVPTTGLSIVAGDVTTQSQTLTDWNATLDTPASRGGVFDFTINTAGAPAGPYTLTFTADRDGDFATTPSKPVTTAAEDVTFSDPDAPTPEELASQTAAKAADAETSKQASQPLTLTIGEPGTGLASATLSLGNSAEDVPFTDADESVAETGSAAADGGNINLVVEAFDEDGGKTNAGLISQIIVIAPGGTIANVADTDFEGGGNSATIGESDTDDPDVDNVGQKMVINVSKTDKKPGTVTVYAIVSGSGGAARTENLTLTFSGAAASLTVADATESLLSVNPVGDDPKTTAVETDYVMMDTIKLVVSAEDSGGNMAAPPTSGVSIVITDPDSKRQGASIIGRSPVTKEADGKYRITLTGMGSKGSPLKAGNWTVTVTKGNLTDTAMFAVAGGPANVAVTASSTSSDTIGDVITVTAMVTDADGNTVSNGTSVMFDVSENTGLAAIGTGHKGKASEDGSAAVKYAVVGAGHSVVSATAGDATGVVVIVSTAGAADDTMADEDASVVCLSNLNGFATWSCSVESSASEIFGLVSGRGATAIHLWNGSSWVRYSVVDGTMVPGSSDFMVTENDILYISN